MYIKMKEAHLTVSPVYSADFSHAFSLPPHHPHPDRWQGISHHPPDSLRLTKQHLRRHRRSLTQGRLQQTCLRVTTSAKAKKKRRGHIC